MPLTSDGSSLSACMMTAIAMAITQIHTHHHGATARTTRSTSASPIPELAIPPTPTREECDGSSRRVAMPHRGPTPEDTDTAKAGTLEDAPQ